MVLVPSVYLVDSDRGFIASCRELFESRGVNFWTFSDPEDLIEVAERYPVGCVISEIAGPGWSGLELCPSLREVGWYIPVVIATSRGDIPTCSQAFRSGVADFLQKPIGSMELWHCIARNLEECRTEVEVREERFMLAQRLSRLTDKEEAVARALVSGQSMKEIACVFGTSFQSVARHRQRILHKLQVENDVALANLIRDCLPNGESIPREFDRVPVIVHD